MNSEEILAFLDSLDLSEDIINAQLNKIMERSTYTNKHLISAVRFLKYKLEVNKQEALDCSNEKEYEFVAKLIKDVTSVNLELVCEITNMVLQLDPITIKSKSEHLLQQILNDIEIPPKQLVSDSMDEPMSDETPKPLISLKLCSSILLAVISKECKLSLPFLQVPLENMVFSEHQETLKFFFLSTIPHFTSAVSGFSILDRLWTCLKKDNGLRELTLKALGSLADYYLPISETAQSRHSKHSIVTSVEFWKTMLFGLQSIDIVTRKTAIYLIKRALESLSGSQKDININTEDVVMVWDKKNERMLKTMWDDFFVLLDSLEEVQSSIVLPSLKLFESVKHLGHCWLSCAYDIGLKHENSAVRLNCIMCRLEIKVESKTEALALLNALNDFNLYESALNSKELTTAVGVALADKNSLMNILEAIPSVKWCPVPLYYLTETLGEVVYPSLLMLAGHKKICTIINDILRIPCNSPVVKKAIFANISSFIVNSCKGFIWEDYLSIYPQLHPETPITSFIMNPLASHIKKNLYLTDADKNGFAEIMVKSCENINIGLLYVCGHEQDGISFFLSIISDKVANILDICSRPYANKTQCIPDVIFLINVFSKTAGRSEPYMVSINAAVMQHYKVIMKYFSSLLSSNTPLEVESIINLFKALKSMPISESLCEDDIFVQLYKSSYLLLQYDDTPLDKKTFATSLMDYLYKNNVMTHHRHEMLSLEQILIMLNNIGKDINLQGSGKLKNTFFERSCEIVTAYLTEELTISDVTSILAYAEDVLDCGGYGCLKHVLKIIGSILPKLIDNPNINFDLSKFLILSWDQICELRTNKEYVVCINEFVKLITQDRLLVHPQYNSVVVGHYNHIVDVAVTKRMPLYFLVKHLSTKNVLMYDNMVNVLCNILLYVIVPKKEQRITENLTIELLSKMQGIIKPDINIFGQHIQFLSIAMLNKVSDVGKLNEISDRMMHEIDQLLKSNHRYYPFNTLHRKLFRVLQNLLFIFLKRRQVDVRKTAFWCMNLLKIPHDNTVKICILWYIALYIYTMDIQINSSLLQTLTANGVPVLCQLTIVYHLLRHKIAARTLYTTETEFILDFLLSHTMGPSFVHRIHAQYYAMLLFETSGAKKISQEKYNIVSTILNKTLGDLAASKDNSFNVLRKDYFTQTFDIVGDLTVVFIFHGLQRRCEQCNENIDTSFAMRLFSEMEESVSADCHDTFFVEWKGIRRWHAFQHYQGLPAPGQTDVRDDVGTIQKKYIPWRNMTELEISKFRQNPKNFIDLIVVASLVDRTPNLGGLARTCEVFGVMTYVIESLRYVQDKQFQSLSVSSDRWLNIEEVEPGQALKDYLTGKRSEGYSIVAAEQTSNSMQLTEFKFPKKTIIMLGHEKNGIPPNILPLMDYCVEIPQRGVIRSLNVHVIASIFVWEYVRQKSVGCST